MGGEVSIFGWVGGMFGCEVVRVVVVVIFCSVVTQS